MHCYTAITLDDHMIYKLRDKSRHAIDDDARCKTQHQLNVVFTGWSIVPL